jgi:Tol biopolymer transport system component
MQVMVKNIQTNKIIAIESKHYTTSPKWSADGNTLFYQDYVEGTCLIKSVSIDKNLNMQKNNVITSCGTVLSMSPLAFNKTWLFFSFKLNDTEPYIIKRFNLITKQEETLTAPSIKHYGDYSLSLDNSGHKLAFIRSITSTKHELMYLNLISGEVKFLTRFSHLPYQIDWSPKANSVVFVNENYTLSSINIKSLKIEPLYQSAEQILGPKIISENELLLIIGDFYTSNINLLDLTNNDSPPSILISSSFKDFGATQAEGNKDVTAFVSNRTGENQLWISDKNEFFQLTNFKENHLLSDLKLSFDVSQLLFTKDHQLFSIDIQSKKVNEITKNNEYIKSPIWLCSSKESLLTIFHSKGESNLYLVNTKSSTRKKLQTSINSVKADCTNNQYYVSKPGVDGIYKLTKNWKIEQDSYHILNTHLADYFEWEVYENNIYYTKKNKLYKLNLINKQQNKLLKGEFSHVRFSLSNQRLIFSKKHLNNTYVAKIKINKSL